MYVGENGKLHFVDKDGADSVLNFNGNLENIDAIGSKSWLGYAYEKSRVINIDTSTYKTIIVTSTTHNTASTTSGAVSTSSGYGGYLHLISGISADSITVILSMTNSGQGQASWFGLK